MQELDARDVPALTAALRAALAGGDAVLPVADGPREPCDSVAGDGLALVIETSGSTGTPKRVGLTASALRASAEATYRWCDEFAGRVPKTRQWLLCLPAHYIAGAQVLVRSIIADTEPVVLVGRFTADSFVAAAGQLDAQARYVSLVPVQLQRLLAAADSETGGEADDNQVIDTVMRRFDAVLVGGQATPRQQLAAARERGWPIVTTYGASETAGGCVYNGQPLPGVIAREYDGEIWLSGSQLAAGYLGDPERQSRTFIQRDGMRWYRTSDAGIVASASDGTTKVQVTGRLDQVIISGGEKVNLGAVERLVQSVPGYEAAVVIAVPHSEWGEAVGVVVEGSQSVSGDEPRQLEAPAQLRHACAAAGRAARPAVMIEVARIPRLASGKPDRQALRQIAAQLPVGHE